MRRLLLTIFQLKEMSFMNPKDNHETNKESIIIEDLPASDEQGEVVRGGQGGGYGILLIDTTTSMNTVR
jgi:hypothetical protein